MFNDFQQLLWPDPMCCQFLSVVRSTPTDHRLNDDDYGTLLKEKNGDITATGREDDIYTFFNTYKYHDHGQLQFKIQSAVDETFLAIDRETDSLITKENPSPDDKSTLFWVRNIDMQYNRIALQSVVGNGCYLFVNEKCGRVIAKQIQDEKQVVNVFFQMDVTCTSVNEKCGCPIAKKIQDEKNVV